MVIKKSIKNGNHPPFSLPPPSPLTCTQCAPSAMNSAASHPVMTPPMPDTSAPAAAAIGATRATCASAIGFTAGPDMPPGVVAPSTVGSGRRLPRTSTPAMHCTVLMRAKPAAPPASAAVATRLPSTSFGVSFNHTGTGDAADTQEHTSWTRSGSWPSALPMRRSGMPCGQPALISKASTPVASTLSHRSSQAPRTGSSMMEAMRMRSGWASLTRLKSSSMTDSGRSEMSSMFSQASKSPRGVFSLA